MTCTHGAPHMTHAPGARCPWCQHTIATDDVPRTVVNVASDTGTGSVPKALVGSRVATIAPEVCGPPVPATSGVAMSDTLFDPGPALSVVGVAVSADRRRTIRQKAALAAGRHPANGLPIGPGTCGECLHLERITYHNRNLLKCANHALGMSHSASSDMRASWPGCPKFTKEPTWRT